MMRRTSALVCGSTSHSALAAIQLRVLRFGIDENGRRESDIGDLFLTQKIEVGVTAGTQIDNGGKVPGEIVGVTTGVIQRKSKGDLQCDLGCPDEFAVLPRLTVNRGFTARSNCIQERLAVASKRRGEGYYAGEQQDAFPVGYGHLVDSGPFSKQLGAKQVSPARFSIGNRSRIRPRTSPDSNRPRSISRCQMLTRRSPPYSRKRISGHGSIPRRRSAYLPSGAADEDRCHRRRRCRLSPLRWLPTQ